jgi:hypothetical protein
MATRFNSQSAAFKIAISKSGLVIASFSAGTQKATMVTNVQQQDARAVAIDAAIVAAIRLHAPEFEAAYLGDDLPLWFDCLLDRCTDAAERIADHTHAPLVETLSALLAQAMVDHDAPGMVPEIGLSCD